MGVIVLARRNRSQGTVPIFAVHRENGTVPLVAELPTYHPPYGKPIPFTAGHPFFPSGIITRHLLQWRRELSLAMPSLIMMRFPANAVRVSTPGGQVHVFGQASLAKYVFLPKNGPVPGLCSSPGTPSGQNGVRQASWINGNRLSRHSGGANAGNLEKRRLADQLSDAYN